MYSAETRKAVCQPVMVQPFFMRPFAAPTLALAVAALASTSPAAAQNEPATSSTLERMASLEAKWRARSEREERAIATRIQEVEVLEDQFEAAEPRSEAIDAVYQRSLTLLRSSLDAVDKALDDAAARSEVPRARRREGRRLFSSASEAGAEYQDQQRAREQEEKVARERLRQLERDLRGYAVARNIDLAGRLWELRESTLLLLPLSRQSQLFLFSPESTAAVRLELEVLGLASRIQLRRTRVGLGTVTRGLRNVYAAAAFGGIILRLALVVLAWRLVQRYRQAGLERVRNWLERIASPERGVFARAFSSTLSTLAPWGTFLLAIAGIRWAFGPSVRDTPFIVPLVILAAAYGGYRLARDAVVGGFTAMGKRAHLEGSPELRLRLEQGVRQVLLVGMLMSAVLLVYRYRLGFGVLATWLQSAALLTFLVVLIAVLVKWREELADACLALDASGPIATLARRGRGSRLGKLLAPVYFAWLAIRALLTLIRDVASGFSRTRKVTGYVLRRRIEREVERRGHAATHLSELPPDLLQALDERVKAPDLLALRPVPGLEEAREAVASWREGGRARALLLAGAHGIGKGAWVDLFCEQESSVGRIRLDRRLTDRGELVPWLTKEILGGTETGGELQPLIQGLRVSNRRVVVLEAAENLFLATINGYHTLSDLSYLVDQTRDKVFWLFSMESLAWNHLQAARKDLAFVRAVETLAPWTEDQMIDLLDRRIDENDFEVSFASLMGEGLGAEDAAARSREGRKAYMDLLWDFCEGNPRVALHYFLRSLEPVGERVLRVRPFHTPSETELEGSGEEALYLLAAVARHGSLTLAEAATVTAYPAGLVESRLTRLLDTRVLDQRDQLFSLSTHWYTTILRLLRRRNVLIA